MNEDDLQTKARELADKEGITPAAAVERLKAEAAKSEKEADNAE